MATPLHLGRATALPALLGIGLLQSTAAAQQTAPATPSTTERSPADAADKPASDASTASGDTRAPAADPLLAPRPAARRGGLAVGISAGLALGSAAGFPNDVQKIGYQRHYTETGVGIGGGGYVWIGGALADWLTFGAAGGGHLLSAKDHGSLAGGFMFHTEVFPLFSLGGPWRDAGVAIDAGTGVAYTTADAAGDDDADAIDGALPARVGVGAFYEGIRLWKVSMGPWLYADYTWSSSVRQTGVYLGWRTALYTGP
ncbi:uncharacterized protein SOCE26_098700 [Sorangium cellulosum]|uniref:Outer membrane protein beta-barrel domain-containing protein n=1 Tax=Sorangium cellulosum TaxID=56 RepID=A0A2L0F9R2_SORCE|nr:hypothetical protein [Sorangium cellulosum]AUX48336.1 uncharacterized protein SOCE26_098700 [Sorangium cellulosum]